MLRIDFDDVQPPRATVVTAEAAVMDVNRQAWAASTTMLVHPAAWYVGLRSQPTFVERGDPIRVDAIVVDLDGAVVKDVPITVQAVRVKWQYTRGEWREVEVDEQLCELTSAAEPGRCTFDTPEGGAYRLTADRRRRGPPQRHPDHPLGERRPAPHGAARRARGRHPHP